MKRLGPPQTFGHLVIRPKADPYAPTTSWWIEADTREAWQQIAAREELRMRLSREHQTLNPITIGLPRQWK